MPRPPLAYVFERFPTFTQTFCVREILELERQGVEPVIFSIHDTRQEHVRQYAPELAGRVRYLPQGPALVEAVQALKTSGALPQAVVLTLRHWEGRPDKNRVYEAAWIGHELAQMGGVRHAHSHFAGIGARTCWWLRKFHGLSYSFTAHANDIFCRADATIPDCARLVRDASLVVTVSDYTASHLRQQFPDSAGRVHRVYNGLDLEPFRAARSGADRSRSAGGILSVGRLIEKKGYDQLILACARLRDEGLNFHCRIVGEGPLELTLREQIHELGLEPLVTLTGPKTMEEITRMLAEETQIFALACQTESDGGKDNLPTVLMEAMAAGLPCVSTRLAGVPEMVLDGVTGLLCDEKDAPAFARCLATLLQDPVRCEQMGQAGLEHARRHFAREVTARSLIRVFARHADVRFDAGLVRRHGLLGAMLRRKLLPSRRVRHRLKKVRDQGFDIDRFMEGA